MNVKNAEVAPAVRPPRSWSDIHTHYLQALEHPWYRSLVELQHELFDATAGFWSQRGVRSAQLPITTGSISSPMGLGSDSRPVKVVLEGVPTYLADSMQFMLEYMCRLLPEGSWYMMPSFRGEQADETHLCQFYHSEAELPGDLDTVMEAVEDYLRDLATALLERSADTIRRTAGETAHVEALADGSQPFVRMRFDEAVAVIGNDPELVQELPPGFRTITRAGEHKLMAEVGEFVWVTHWDHLAVPFYQAFDDDSLRVARNADLLFGPGEVVGAGERHVDRAQVERALALHQVSAADYAWYWGMKERVPMLTSGFGLGTERFLMWVLRHDDIRDCQLLPRFNGVNVTP